MKQSILFVLASLLLVQVSWAQKKYQTLLNKAGKQVAYIDHSNALYLTKNQEQVAYLIASENTDVLRVYGMEGQRLGFFREGILYNDAKYIAAYVAGALHKIESAMAADKGIESVLMDLHYYGWLDIEKFLQGK